MSENQLVGDARPLTVSPESQTLPDLTGEFYLFTLQRLHSVLQPKTYLEIGTLEGGSLAQARCASIAIDPLFRIHEKHLVEVFKKPELHCFQMGSDAFFEKHDPKMILGSPIELAFLDGMHRCEFLLRDFMNTERHCKKNSVIVLHDCVPVEHALATRVPQDMPPVEPHRAGWWAGDVWRTSLLLKRYRPDLVMTAVDAMPTGLVMITNLNPNDRSLEINYAQYVGEMLGWELEKIGPKALYDEMGVKSTNTIKKHDEITKLFWL